MNKEIELVEGQVVDVEFDSELVKAYQDNYIMEEEGIGAEMGEVYDQQTTVNSDTMAELMSEDTIIDTICEVGGDNE